MSLDLATTIKAAAAKFGGDHSELIRRAVDTGALDVLEDAIGGVVDSFAASKGIGAGELDEFRATAVSLRVSAIRTGTAEAIRRVQADEGALLRLDSIMGKLGESRDEQQANAALLQGLLDGATELALRLLPLLIAGAA